MRALAPNRLLESAGSCLKRQQLSGLLLGCAFALGCTAQVDNGATRTPGNPGVVDPNASTGGNGNTGTTGGVGNTGATSATGATGPTTSMGGGLPVPSSCDMPTASRAPMRRLTRFEYSNTLLSLLGDSTSPGNKLAGEIAVDGAASGFSNDVDLQAISSKLASDYVNTAEEIATRATVPGALPTLLPCAATASTAQAETDCINGFIPTFAANAYRRPLAAGEAEALSALFQTVRASGTDFAGSVSAVIQGVLNASDFLYRPEFGVAVPGRTDLLRPSGSEMASRLSYLYWGTMPDAALSAAAANGELNTPAGVLTQATRLLNDKKTENNLAFFFDSLLPISRVSGLVRDPAVFPKFSGTIGGLMERETQEFLKAVILTNNGNLDTVFTAPYTYLNDQLATFYGVPGVSGPDFRQVALPEPAKRIGLLTQAAVITGTVARDVTNPVTRGAFIVKKLLCQNIPKPSGAILAMIKPPDPYSFPTARERYAAHSKDPGCATCHAQMDPAGLAQENFDAIGLWRDTENNVTIDATGTLPILGAPFNGPVELAQRVAATKEVGTCFAGQWMTFGYGRAINPADKCTVDAVQKQFLESGNNVKSLLTALAQSDAFLYMSSVKE